MGTRAGTPSPGQGSQEPSARQAGCPGTQAWWEFSPPLLRLCFRLPSGPPRQLGTAAKATPVPGLATSQPKIPGLGAKAPEPVLPPGVAGHHHPFHFAHSEHTPPPDLVSGLLGPWEKNLPSLTLGNCLWGPGKPTPLQLGAVVLIRKLSCGFGRCGGTRPQSSRALTCCVFSSSPQGSGGQPRLRLG